MKWILIILLIIPFGAKAQMDTTRWLVAQVSILTSMIGTNKKDFVAYKTQTDQRIKILEDSMKKIRPLIFDTTKFNFTTGIFKDSVSIK